MKQKETRSIACRTFVRILSLKLLLVIPLIQTVFCSSAAFAGAGGDDFDDNNKNSLKWGPDQLAGHGVMTEKNQRLEYTCSSGTVEDLSTRPWILTQLPYNADWEMQIDAFNSTSPNTSYQVNSFGIQIFSPFTAGNAIFAEQYSSALGGLPARTGFYTSLDTGGASVANADPGALAATNGAVRMVFDSATKVITVFYDGDISDGYQWVQYGTFGLAGSGGTNGNTHWGLADTNQFLISVYGYSAGMTVASGQMYGDNFMVTGDVTPVGGGGPPPDPTGSFGFGFPTNNPLLAAIANIAGNYQGKSPTRFNRSYNIDVAQDESGKLAVMGTADGIQDANGNPEISGVTGSMKTVSGEPTAQIKGSFKGTRDGVSTTFSGTGAGPVDVIDVGGGTNGIGATASYKSKVGGVPFGERNLPLLVAAPPGAVDNLKKDWSIQLNINKKIIKGKEATVASALLVLPNGDTNAYPEKVIKYSATKGYSLSFKGGTNTTINPPAIDRKSSITIKGLKFVQQGADWQPTAGAITYQFLGQKGTANLMDFVAP